MRSPKAGRLVRQELPRRRPRRTPGCGRGTAFASSSSWPSVRLCVTNGGEPIAAAALQSLFEPLRRGGVEPRDASEQDGHLGLGLFIVREIARAHGGEVEVVSAEGRTAFTVSLPRSSGGMEAAGRGSS